MVVAIPSRESLAPEDISSGLVHIPSRSKLITPGPHSPMAGTEELRALLERKCAGMRFIEDQSIAFKSFRQCVCIVYAYIIAMIDK